MPINFGKFFFGLLKIDQLHVFVGTVEAFEASRSHGVSRRATHVSSRHFSGESDTDWSVCTGQWSVTASRTKLCRSQPDDHGQRLKLVNLDTRAASGVVRIDPLHFVADVVKATVIRICLSFLLA